MNATATKKKTKEWTATEIRKLRKRLRLTQREAAESLGADHTLWSHWEAGRHAPTKPFQFLLDFLDRGLLEPAA